MDPQNVFKDKLKRVKNLFSQLYEVTNNINALCDLNSFQKTQKCDPNARTNVPEEMNMQNWIPKRDLEPATYGDSLHLWNESCNRVSVDNFRPIISFNSAREENSNVYLHKVPNDMSTESESASSKKIPLISACNGNRISCSNAGRIIEADIAENTGSISDEDVDVEIIDDDEETVPFGHPSKNNIDLVKRSLEPKTLEHHIMSSSNNLNLTHSEPDVEISDWESCEPKRNNGCDIMAMVIPTSDGPPKKLCCVFCKKQYRKLERHLRTVHRNETAVKKFAACPPRSKSRREMIAKIRKQGEFLWNSDYKLNRGVMQTGRRPNKKFVRYAWQRIVCAHCAGSYSTNTLRHHWRKCTGNWIMGERIVKQLGRACESRIHPSASDELNTVFSKFRDNETIRGIQFDWLASCYGNELCLNYSPYYQEGYIRSKIGAAAKLLHHAKKLSSEITDLSSLFNVRHCNTVIEVVRKMGKFDIRSKMFGSPGTAYTTTTLINTVGELLITESMKLDDEEKEKNAERFLKVFKRDVRTKINKLVAITIAKNRRHKKPNIPITDDIKKLVEFLNSERDQCYEQLSEAYSYQTWLKLSQLTLASIMVFNRRRAGEMRNIAISDFSERENIGDQCDMILGAMSTTNGIKSRMQIRGKLGRTVPVLLKAKWENCINVLIRNRENVGLPKNNDYLFAVPTQSSKAKTINVWAALNSFAKECGAQNPSSLKGTNLRKHLASYCSTKDLKDVDITNLAEYMGHDDRVHLKIYRKNPLVSQVSQIAPILNNAQGDDGYMLPSETRKRKTGRSPLKVTGLKKRKIQVRKTKIRKTNTSVKSAPKNAKNECTRKWKKTAATKVSKTTKTAALKVSKKTKLQ